ncbi:MAG: hypothetical protein GWN01_09325 [Nitrosopumilaceae archaeon]|nr:hypothetical protein [Nitrosopumilaceae archaeon]NIU87810.1 hypothetical protein [Nitrosopumilaceae archaeon]NIV65192.1 hypothetical protein [Nitrosopumilaceae archaeon]NIX61708.1 hypothetical protein [Nitrosopumilaceae archaeon]
MKRTTKIKTKSRIRISSAKQKARRLQRWVCCKISLLIDLPWGSSGQDQPIESRAMGQSGPDIRLERHACLLFPFSVECKCQEKWNVHSWIDQAQSNKRPGTDWLIVAKRSRKTPVVIMDAETFFSLVDMKNKKC